MFKLIEARVLIFILLLIFFNNILISKLYAFCLFLRRQSAPKSSTHLLLYERVWWNMEWIIKILNIYSHICNCNFSGIYGRARKKIPSSAGKTREVPIVIFWSIWQETIDFKKSRHAVLPYFLCLITEKFPIQFISFPRNFWINYLLFKLFKNKLKQICECVKVKCRKINVIFYIDAKRYDHLYI